MDTIHYHNGERLIRFKSITDLQPDKTRQLKVNKETKEQRIELYRVRVAAGLDVFTGNIGVNDER
jgi:hypothetical protein|tara:strand:- start:430 stop:624 length:195 start_codon:yes stop_codon:yes gene_type:complete